MPCLTVVYIDLSVHTYIIEHQSSIVLFITLHAMPYIRLLRSSYRSQS
jgi:hypothetical protein